MKFRNEKQRKAVMAKMREMKGIVRPVPHQKYIDTGISQNRIIKRPYSLQRIKESEDRYLPKQIVSGTSWSDISRKQKDKYDRATPEYVEQANLHRRNTNERIMHQARSQVVYDTSHKKLKKILHNQYVNDPAITKLLSMKGEDATIKALNDYSNIYTWELVKRYVKPEMQKKVARVDEAKIRRQLFAYWYLDKDKKKFSKADIQKPRRPFLPIPSRRKEYEKKLKEYKAYKFLWRGY